MNRKIIIRIYDDEVKKWTLLQRGKYKIENYNMGSVSALFIHSTFYGLLVDTITSFILAPKLLIKRLYHE